MESQSSSDAAAALGLVASSRAGLADRLVTPWWFHPALGLLLGGLIAGQALDSPLLHVVSGVVYGLGILTLVKLYRKRTGVWLNAARARRARPFLVAFVILTLTVYLGSLALESAGWENARIVAGALMVPIVVVMGRLVDEAIVAELRSC